MSLLLVLAAVIPLGVGPQSGPGETKPIPKLKVVVVRDNLKAAEEVTKAREEKPTVYLFVPREKWDRPMARFVRKLDEQLEDVEAAKSVFVWISTDSAENSAEYLRKVQTSLNLARTTWTVYHGEVADISDWELNPDVLLTAVIAKKGKVVKNVAFTSVNETDVPDVMKLFK